MKKILAPTNGSPDSDRAIDLAQRIALAQGAELVLVVVINQSPLAMGRTIGPPLESEAERYAAEVATRLRAEGVDVRVRVEWGVGAETLIECEREEHADLLVMATHGRTGWVRLALGSMADQLVREGSAPVLLVRRTIAVPSALESAMVMLDGSGFGERALAMAAELAGKPLRSVTLFRAVGDEKEREAAEAYLKEAMSRLPLDRVRAAVRVETGEARHVIQQAAGSFDLVILATHGRGGFDRWRHGSVADHVVSYVERPILLVRANGEKR